MSEKQATDAFGSLDVHDFKPKTAPKPRPALAEVVATGEKAGFAKREARRERGKTYSFHLYTKQVDTIDNAIDAYADTTGAGRRELPSNGHVVRAALELFRTLSTSDQVEALAVEMKK